MALIQEYASLGATLLKILIRLVAVVILVVLSWQAVLAAYDRYQIGLALEDVIPQIGSDMGDAEIKGLFAKTLSVREVGDFEPGLLVIRRTHNQVFLFYHTTTNLGLPALKLSYPLDLTTMAHTQPLRGE